MQRFHGFFVRPVKEKQQIEVPTGLLTPPSKSHRPTPSSPETSPIQEHSHQHLQPGLSSSAGADTSAFVRDQSALASQSNYPVETVPAEIPGVPTLSEIQKKNTKLGKITVPDLELIQKVPSDKLEIIKLICIQQIQQMQEKMHENGEELPAEDVQSLLRTQRMDYAIRQHRWNIAKQNGGVYPGFASKQENESSHAAQSSESSSNASNLPSDSSTNQTESSTSNSSSSSEEHPEITQPSTSLDSTQSTES